MDHQPERHYPVSAYLRGDATLSAPQGSPATAAAESSKKYRARSRSKNTRRNYNTCWKCPLRLCAEWGECPLPMQPRVAAWIVSHLADTGYTWGWIRNVRTAIRMAHILSELPDPTAHIDFLLTYEGIARTIGTKPRFQKAAIFRDDMLRIRERARTRGLRGIQEWSAKSLAWVTALRRINVVGIDWEDISPTPTGISIWIAHSKTDQYGEGRAIDIDRDPDPEYCPVAALDAWKACLPDPTGPVFRRILPGNKIADTRLSDRTLCRWVKAYAPAVEGVTAADLGAHSLRAGPISQWKLDGVDDIEIAERAGHDCLDTTRGYIRLRGKHRINFSLAVTA